MTEPDHTPKFVRTLKLRVKDKHAAELSRQARAVNFVWNYVNELSERSIRERGRFLSAYDLHAYTTGASRELGLHSHTVQRVNAAYVQARVQFKKRKLAWRKSGGARRSLGWVPFNTGHAKWKNGQVFFGGTHFNVWTCGYTPSDYTLKSGSFSEDSRGRWYFNVAVEVEAKPSSGTSAVGIDLGCKDAATCSDGKVLHGRWYRREQAALGIAQRARKKDRVKAIHAKVKNRRKDAHHKESTRLVRENGAVFVGSVSPKAIARTSMSKSSLDAGWAAFKTMLEYKCARAGVVYECVDERYSTQSCSCCGVIPDSSPKGRAGLGMREWTCSGCGAHHDRDINAARNILARGLSGLAGGTHECREGRNPFLQGGE